TTGVPGIQTGSTGGASGGGGGGAARAGGFPLGFRGGFRSFLAGAPSRVSLWLGVFVVGGGVCGAPREMTPRLPWGGASGGVGLARRARLVGPLRVRLWPVAQPRPVEPHLAVPKAASNARHNDRMFVRLNSRALARVHAAVPALRNGHWCSRHARQERAPQNQT